MTADTVIRNYACEKCGTKVALKPTQARRLEHRIRCQSCSTTTARTVRKGTAKTAWKPTCERCCGDNRPTLHYRLDSNLREHRMRLCSNCARALSYTPYDWGRIAHGITSVGKSAT